MKRRAAVETARSPVIRDTLTTTAATGDTGWETTESFLVPVLLPFLTSANTESVMAISPGPAALVRRDFEALASDDAYCRRFAQQGSVRSFLSLGGQLNPLPPWQANRPHRPDRIAACKQWWYERVPEELLRLYELLQNGSRMIALAGTTEAPHGTETKIRDWTDVAMRFGSHEFSFQANAWKFEAGLVSKWEGATSTTLQDWLNAGAAQYHLQPIKVVNTDLGPLLPLQGASWIQQPKGSAENETTARAAWIKAVIELLWHLENRQVDSGPVPLGWPPLPVSAPVPPQERERKQRWGRMALKSLDVRPAIIVKFFFSVSEQSIASNHAWSIFENIWLQNVVIDQNPSFANFNWEGFETGFDISTRQPEWRFVSHVGLPLRTPSV